MTATAFESASQRFSANRFVRLLRAQWAEQRKSILGLALVLLIVQVLLALVLLTTSSGGALMTEAQRYLYYVGLLCSGYVVASLYFTPLGRPEANLLYLMRPAAVLEKWLAAALALLLLWPLLYTLVFALVMGPASAVGFQQAVQHYQEITVKASPGAVRAPPNPAHFALFWPFVGAWGPAGSPLHGSAPSQLACWLAYASVTAYPLLFGLYFRRHAAIKALALGFGLFMATLVLLALVNPSPGVLVWWDASPGGVSPWARVLLCVAFWLGVPALLWAGSLRALRERDMV